MNVRTRYVRDDRVDVIEGEHLRSVPLEAVATRMELLGYSDPADALAACLAEMRLGEDTHPYDGVYDSYLPYLRLVQGHREGPVKGAFGPVPEAGAAGAQPPEERLEEARRRARAEIGAPEPARSEPSGAGAAGRPVRTAANRDDAVPGAEEDYAEVFALLRAEPLIAELRQEFRDQLVPPAEPGGNG